MQSMYVGFVVWQRCLKANFLVFPVLSIHFHVCDLETTENDVRSKEKT